MTKFNAVLVEDDPDQVIFSSDILQSCGFEVVSYADASSALLGMQESAEPLDLIVLDRRLPREPGDVETDESGDELLDAIHRDRRDAICIVFTGHTGLEHVQFAMGHAGSIDLGRGRHVFNRVVHFKKSQSLEFETYVKQIQTALLELDAIEVMCLGEQLPPLQTRIVRRVAYEYGGQGLTVRPLAGGLTNAAVFLLEVRADDDLIAKVVVKASKKMPPSGGFQSLLPASLVAGSVNSIRGFCGERYATVYQVAGADPVPLMTLLRDDPELAQACVSQVRIDLDQMLIPSRAIRSVAELAAPYVDWSTLTETLAEFSLDIPNGQMYATSDYVAQHGDLHPANILVSGRAPLLIDFDSQVIGSAVLDPVALLLGAIFHLDSPFRDAAWPSPTNMEALGTSGFLTACPAADYFKLCWEWAEERSAGPRELWAIILAFAGRQLSYADVKNSPRMRSLALAVCAKASDNLE